MTSTYLARDRVNTRVAELVDMALDLRLEFGAHTAAAFLASYGASFATTVRVLSSGPERRRPAALGDCSARTSSASGTGR